MPQNDTRWGWSKFCGIVGLGIGLSWAWGSTEAWAQEKKPVAAANDAAKGKDILTSKGCLACHSEDGTPRVGPTLKGLYGSDRTVITAGKERVVKADDEYLKRSIVDPKADLVKGFENLPMVSPPLSEDEIKAVITYLKTLVVKKATTGYSPQDAIKTSYAQQGKDAKPATPAEAALAAKGKELIGQKACLTCHSLDGSRRVAPSFLNIYGRETKVRTQGKLQTVTADEAYLRRSIEQPDADLVAGYHLSMMPKISLAKEELDGIIAFLKYHRGTAVVDTAKKESLPPLTIAEQKQASQIYFDRCAGCHGMLRGGATGPALVPERLRSRNLTTESLKTFVTYGLPGGMPAWGQAGVLSPSEVDLIARFLQHPAPQPPEMSLAEMKKHWKVFVAPDKRPKKPEHARKWENFVGVVLRDTGKVAILDGDTKETLSVVDTGFAVHILRSSASGRYFYSTGRDGKLTIIDLWMKTPDKVAEGKTCYDARSIDSSKYKGPKGDFMDKLLIAGCYWPPSLVIMDGETLEPKKIVSTSSYTYDTNEFVREARVAAIAASHHEPEWIINIKETGYIWVLDYTDLQNLRITSIASERFLHDGGFDLSRRYILMAANARNAIAVVDLKTRKLVALVKVDATPHPGRGANIDHPTYGPIWCTGHLGAPTIACIGTDPLRYPQYAWKVVSRMTMPGQGGGNLFIKTHPKSKWLYADRTLNPSRDLYRSIFVFDKHSFQLAKTLKLAETYPGRAVHIEYNQDGSETYISAWSPKNQPSALLIYNDATLELKRAFTAPWLITPTGKWNVFNTKNDIY